MATSFRSLAVTMLVVAVAGCAPGSKMKVVPVSGKVTYKGAAVSGATVTFLPQSEGGEGSKAVHAATAVTDAQGAYKLVTMETMAKPLDGAVPGKYNVTVTKFGSAGGIDAMMGAGKKITADAVAQMSDDEKRAMAGQKSGLPVAGSSQSDSAALLESQAKSELPEKYGKAAESGLTFEVKDGGPQVYDIPLTEE